MTGLESFGGKGTNLIRLREAGFPVPPFVVVPVREYRAFVAEHGLEAVIEHALTGRATDAAAALADAAGPATSSVAYAPTGPATPTASEVGPATPSAADAPTGPATPADAEAGPTTPSAAAASATIRAAFRRPLSADQRARIVATIGDLADQPVAVRSSATAEDLPDASFAGQQDTFLDVTGVDAILDKVVECWSSLWTERAITYRARTGIAAGRDIGAGRDGAPSLGLAVVVQQMVPAEASGVVFTADPLSGRRDRVVVDAVAGLGEKLVSGQVTPDHYEVEGGRIAERTVQGDQPALTDAQLLELVALSRRVAEHFGAPQDIEFTRVGDELQLVQSRPITGLFPVPEGDREAIYMSFGAVQGVLGPITPLGREVLAYMASGLYALGRPVEPAPSPYVRTAGERLWVRIDGVVTGPGRPVALAFLRIAEPISAAILTSLLEEPAYASRAGRRAKLGMARGAVKLIGPLLPTVVANLRDPEAARARFARIAQIHVDGLAATLSADAAQLDPQARLNARIRTIELTFGRVMGVWIRLFGPIMGPSLGMLRRLRALAAQTGLPDADALAMSILRALPDNVTTQMDLALNAAARRIASDPASVEAISGDPAQVADAYRHGALPQVAVNALDDFLAAYGMRAVAEIDLGTPRWRERPDQVIRTIATYLADTDHAVTYEQGRREAELAIETLASALPRHKAAQVRLLGSRLRGLFGLRETPKFTMVRLFGHAREALQASGRDLVEAGRLDEADDVFFLGLAELRTAFTTDHRARVSERKAARERESRRTRVPVVLVGDGRTYYSAPGGTHGDLVGSGVSPGVVTAAVRVVDDPATAELQPGEIMVCRGTDPAWTPLFLTAGGLVTEVGGLMTHGSVVAREYGLPAVVGIPDATRLLATGDVITLDGSTGTITREVESDAARG